MFSNPKHMHVFKTKNSVRMFCFVLKIIKINRVQKRTCGHSATIVSENSHLWKNLPNSSNTELNQL